MNLFEIISSEISPTKDYHGQWVGRDEVEFDRDDSTTADEGEVIGGGQVSTVKATKDDPHTVIKYQHLPTSSSEASFMYAEYVIENELWTNPHFPRFYKLDTYRDEKGRIIQKVKMEKLHNYRSLSIDDVNAIINSNFTNYAIKRIEKKAEKLFERDGRAKEDIPESDQAQVYFVTIGIALNAAYLSAEQQDKIIASQSIDNAITNLRMIHHEINERLSPYKSVYDMHSNNMMIRRGPYVPQIVFADPFRGGS